MTDEAYDQFRKQLNTLYTDEEMKVHLLHRPAKSALEILTAENFYLITLAKSWTDYVKGECEKPNRDIWSYLMPGNDRENSMCDQMHRLVEFYSSFDYCTAPKLPIAIICSRTSLQILHTLENLYHLPDLDLAASASKKFFTIIANESHIDYTREELKTELNDLAEEFLSALKKYASELHHYLKDYIAGNRPIQPVTKEDIEQAIAPLATKQDVTLTVLSGIDTTTKRIDDREKHNQRKKKNQYTKEQLIGIHTLWLKAQQNPNVQELSSGKTNYESAFQYYKKEFIALGVNSPEELGKALKAWRQRASR